MEHHQLFHHLERPYEASNAAGSSPADHQANDDQFQLESTDSHTNQSTSNVNGQNMNSSGSGRQGDNSSYCDIWQMTSPAEIAAKLVIMTQAPRICFEMRNDGVLPLLVQFLHQHSTEDGMLSISGGASGASASRHELESGYHQATSETFRSTFALRRNSAKALRNIVTHTAKNKKEVEILGLLEDLRSFVEIFYLKWSDMPVEAVDHPCSQLAEIFTFACDSNYKKTIELYGGIYVISDVIQSDFRFHCAGNTNEQCFLLRQYSLNVLTYLTAQNDIVKSVLGSMRPFIGMLVETLQQTPQQNNLQLLQSVANVLHNLSWKSDFNSKQIMRDVKTVFHLAKLAMMTKDLKTLKALLEPLLNLTAHCTPNKIDFCKVDGVLDFLISKLKTNVLPTTSSTLPLNPTELAIVENSGGILRNISSYLVTQEDLIERLRAQNIVAILLEQLKAASLAIVSNACITLSYLAARSSNDALRIKELGGIQILHGLTNSKHEPIKLGASKTLQHLFTSHLTNYNASFKDTPTMSTSYSIPSSLQMRKLKAFKTEINSFLSENFDTLPNDASPNDSPNHRQNCNINYRTSNPNSMSQCNHSAVGNVSSKAFYKVTRSSSHDSIGSTHSEPATIRSLHRRSMQSSASTAASSDHKSAAAAALQNLSAKSGNSPHDQRMIHSYSGQTLNSLYATLPASSRIVERTENCDEYSLMESACVNDAASDYDISICDISGSSLVCPPPPLPPHKTLGKNSSSTVNNSTPDYLQEEQEEDPAPTDYSQRFKEQAIDDFSTPQFASKNDASTGEDTVKVYQTENTPLAFSLAPSLSDLRDVSSSAAGNFARLVDENEKHKMNNLPERFNKLELNRSVQNEKLFKKPILAAKPPVRLPSSSTSFYNSKIPYSIDEKDDEFVNNQQNSKTRSGIAKSMSNHDSLKDSTQMSGPKNSKKYMSGEPSKQYTRSNSMSAIMYNNDKYDHLANVGTGNNSSSWTTKPSSAGWANKPTPDCNMTTPQRTVIDSKIIQQADSPENYAARDSAQCFATENTPAIFSHATSLSSLSIDDDLDDFDSRQPLQQKALTKSTSQTYDKNAAPRALMSNSVSTATHQKSNQLSSSSSNSVAIATNQNNSTSSSKQSKLSALKMMSASSATLVKTIQVTAERLSKTQTTQHLSNSATPPLRQPKKPLPSIPLNESPSLKMQVSLPPTSTSTTDLPDNDDDDYDDFMFKCRQLVMPKETQMKPKTPIKASNVVKQNSSFSSTQKPFHNNVNNKNTSFLRKQLNPPVQMTTSNRVNSNHSPNFRNIHKTSAKAKNTSNSDSYKSTNAVQPKQPSSKTRSTSKTTDAELSNTDEDDDLLLNQCMQIAINKQSHHHSKSSSRKTSARHLNSSSRDVKPSQAHKKSPASTSVSEKIQYQITHNIKLFPNEPSQIEQAKQFCVENTPVQFSQCHSPLSLLSVDSGDEIEVHKLVKTAIQFASCDSEDTQGKTKENARANTAGQQEMSETESESATTTLTNNAAAAATSVSNSLSSSSTHVRNSSSSSRTNQTSLALEQQRRVSPGSRHRGKTKLSTGNGDNARNQQRQTVINNNDQRGSSASAEPAKSRVVARQQSNQKGSGSADRPNTVDNEPSSSSFEDDDERTYTICTQSSRHSSATLTGAINHQPEHSKTVNPSVLVMSNYSFSGSVHNIEGENPPSLVDDHNLMFSSTETNMTRSGLKFIPQPRATSARTKKTTSGALGYELQTSYPGQHVHSLEDHSANSLLENQKPPSIMEHSSFMSQSTASITSEISDIALDQVPLRKSSTDLVAEIASNYAKEISNLADQLCFTGTVLVSVDENVSLSPVSAVSSPSGSSKRLAAVKSNNGFLIEQQSDQTFDMEPSPTPRTLLQNSSAKTNTTTVTVGRTSSNTRTYNKTDKTKNTNTTDKTLKSSGKMEADLEDSDTDISENLPLDDVQTKTGVHSSPTKCSFLQGTMPLFTNPMDFPKQSKKPPHAPRYKPRSTHHAPSNFELTDDSSDDERRLHLAYSQSLNSQRISRSSRKNSKSLDTAFAQHKFGNSRVESNSFAAHSEMKQTNPYSNHHQMAFNSLGRQGYSSAKVKKENDIEDKDLLFTAKHKNTVAANQTQFFQSKSNTPKDIKSASKYFDRHAAVLSSMAHDDHFQTNNEFPIAIESAIPIPVSKRSNSSDFSKLKENDKSLNKEKEKSSSIFSKISSSFSSHNIGSHSANSGQSTSTTPTTPSSTKTSFNKINSKIASFWRRSKSSHDKLDQEALTANPSKNMKAAKINKYTVSQNNTSNFVSSDQSLAGLPRSSTYEKLPANEDEAARMSSRHLENSNITDCGCVVQPAVCTRQHFGSGTKPPVNQITSITPSTHNSVNEQSHLHSPQHQFTFTTFVKIPSSNIGSSIESVSTQSSANRFYKKTNYDPHLQHSQQQPKTLPFQSAEIATVPFDQTDVAVTAVTDSLVEDTSGISSASSNQQSRKTCLVTTV